MPRKKTRELANDPNFIEGIYNYCDRWCERCPFTENCMNFALSEERFPNSESQDINNKEFWEGLSKIYQETMEMIQESAEKLGIDLNSIDTEESAGDESKKSITAKNHQCCRAANTYSKMVDSWFENSEEAFSEKEKELKLAANLNLLNTSPQNDAIAIQDTVEIIRWYQHQIYIKLTRAIRGTIDDDVEREDDEMSDSNGSAKVALIGMDRSLAAWGELLNQIPNHEDEILKILVQLERLRSNTEAALPKARSFIRPGFDTINEK